MLEIISGRAGSGKTAYCLEQIKNKLLAQPVGDAIILLLPEHMTYKAERELAAMLAKEGRGFCRCYVYGFRRFAYQILQETGGGLEPGLTDLGRQLLLRQLLDRRLKDKSLSAFARAAGQRGFAAELGDIINELKSYCISPELLQEIGSQVAEKDKRLSGKLQDMALIYQDFNEAMAGSYNDGKDILCKLLEKLPKSKIVQGAELWLDGFLFFNPLEKQLLQVLFGLCSQVYVSLTLDNSTLSDCQPWQNVPREDIFYRSQSTRNYLLELAGEMNMEARERFMAGGARFSHAYGQPHRFRNRCKSRLLPRTKIVSVARKQWVGPGKGSRFPLHFVASTLIRYFCRTASSTMVLPTQDAGTAVSKIE